jgi:putative SOS response-associated peptidase YedK
MCGRYTLATPNPADVRARFPVGDGVVIHRRYNIAPGDEVLAVTTGRDGSPRGELLRWGLVPPWAQGPRTELKMINARAETVAERPAFRSAFERFRCLIVADGFYEWRRTPLGAKHAFHITRADGEVFAFAGLWSSWRGEDGKQRRTCTILTTAANEAVAPLHDRMPIILAASGERAWLDASTPRVALTPLLSGLPSTETLITPVGPAVNDARYDGPECLAPPLENQPALF